MVILKENETCELNVSAKLRSGVSLISVKPLFSHDSQYVLIVSGSNVKVFRIKSGECIQVLQHHIKPIISITENKKNNLQVFSCSTDGVVVRWDYISGDILQIYNLEMPVTTFYTPLPDGPWFVTKQYKDQYRLYSLKPKQKGCSNVSMILKPVEPKENSIAFGFMGKFCASILGKALTIYKFESQSINRHMTGERNLTCVTCHPSDFVLATGDEHGRVVVWSNALESSKPIRSIYHWHSLAVADLAFTPEGSYLYSGGGEAVLVKWNLFSEGKFPLPRMGAPISYVNVSKDNSYVITAHSDNVLQVTDAQRHVVQVIQGLTKSHPQNDAILPTGLLYDAHLKALLMNGKPGHLQFYDIAQDKQLFNLDIAGKNLISQERDSVVINIDVQKAAVDDTGMWLATAEYWNNGDTSPQIWLKLWMFDVQKQIFVLNTNVILPHNKELSCIVFRPSNPKLDAVPLLATTSKDGRFKIWTLGEVQSDGKQCWNCESMGYYRDFSAGDACFSEDGSLLAVAFESVATLWSVQGTALKAVLCNDKNKKNIKQLLFGHQSWSHYLICQDGFSLTMWNVLSLSITWIVHNEIQVLAADLSSSNIAAFCKDQRLIIFRPDSPKPLHYIEKVSETPVISAIFVPFTSSAVEESTCFHKHSQLFFINEAQNLLSVSETEVEDEAPVSEKKTVAQNIVETPFGMLQADKKVSDVKKIKPKQFNFSLQDGEKIIPNPVLQNPLAVCKAILPTMLLPSKKEANKESHSNEAESSKIKKEDDILKTIDIENMFKDLNLDNCVPKVLDFSFLSKMVSLPDSLT